MSDLAKKVFELFGKPEIAAEPPAAYSESAREIELPLTQAFLERYIPPSTLGEFPDWRGLLINSAVLGMNVWVVRNAKDGEELAKETGQPALVLDDVLAQKGKTKAEARAALLPLLIVGGMQ